MENVGQIKCHFTLLDNNTPFSKAFDFKLKEYTLVVDEKLQFRVEFQSKILGEFSETFKWKLRGTKELLYLTYKGHVIAPTFKTVQSNTEEPLTEINFGIVSY